MIGAIGQVSCPPTVKPAFLTPYLKRATLCLSFSWRSLFSLNILKTSKVAPITGGATAFEKRYGLPLFRNTSTTSFGPAV